MKLARYFSTLKGESDADAASLAARVRELAGADDFDSAGVAAVLADETPLVAQIPDKELEGVTNLLHAFVALLKSPERTRALIKAVGASPARPGPRLRLLTTIYNAQPETDALRCDAFEAIVEVAAASNELDVLDEFLPRLDAEMVRWGIGADKSREIYLMLSEKYAAQGSQEARWELDQLT